MTTEVHDEDGPTDTDPGLPTARWTGDRERVVAGLGLAALLAVAGATALRTLYNLPFDPVPVSPSSRSVAGAAMLAVLTVTLVGLVLSTGRRTVRVGLLFAAVFGVLPAFDAAATLPGAVGVTGGASLALLGTVGVPDSYRAFRRFAVAAGFVAGVAVSLAAATGLVDVGLRQTGSLLVVAAILGTGIRVQRDRLAAAVGVLVLVATLALTGANPYVAGSALLVAFAVVGVPHLLVAAAVGVCAAVGTAAVRRGEYATATGAGLLVVAGMPATFPRALAVLLGAALVLLPAGALAPGTDRGRSETEVAP
ncbi:phosphate ABC transporter permease [Haloarchaeobius baliensis]|uniref:phosphate ABC transporter permease n=1 Tax=Haloarchaeobius baliensis TaxID=1670458 RepID=UPI003F8846F7